MVYSVGLRSVVAGVGGSSSRRSAVRIAAEYAVRHRLPLQLVCGFPSASYGWPALGMAGYAAVVSQRARRDADAVLAEAADELRSAYLGLSAVTTLSSVGGPAAVLVAASRLAAATVVGSGESDRSGGLAPWAAAVRVAVRAHSSVIVARADRPTEAVVVVGVDWSDRAAAAVRFAADESAARGAPLVVAHALPVPGGRGDRGVLDALELLARYSEQATARCPGLVVHTQLIPAIDPAEAMVGTCARAALTVVGSRGDGGYPGRRLGSLARRLVRAAASPVAVVRPAR